VISPAVLAGSSPQVMAPPCAPALADALSIRPALAPQGSERLEMAHRSVQLFATTAGLHQLAGGRVFDEPSTVVDSALPGALCPRWRVARTTVAPMLKGLLQGSRPKRGLRVFVRKRLFLPHGLCCRSGV